MYVYGLLKSSLFPKRTVSLICATNVVQDPGIDVSQGVLIGHLELLLLGAISCA